MSLSAGSAGSFLPFAINMRHPYVAVRTNQGYDKVFSPNRLAVRILCRAQISPIAPNGWRIYYEQTLTGVFSEFYRFFFAVSEKITIFAP